MVVQDSRSRYLEAIQLRHECGVAARRRERIRHRAHVGVEHQSLDVLRYAGVITVPTASRSCTLVAFTVRAMTRRIGRSEVQVD